MNAFVGLPPVCEFGDLANALTWNDPADHHCGATGGYLLVGSDAPSPLCEKHAQLLLARLDLERLGMRMERS